MPNGGANLAGHAVVVGGGMSGLMAARVLADHYARVTLLERDQYPLQANGRKGTPQARHIHVLLMAGRRALESLFPGLIGELLKAGAVEYDASWDIAWNTPVGWCARCRSSLLILGATRDLIEWGIRERVLRTEHIVCRQQVDVTGLRLDPGRKRVVGVSLEDRARGLVGQHLEADLVIDASGRGSRTPQWLETAGFPRPQERVVNSFLGYASRFVRPPVDWKADWKALYIQSAPPLRKRGGVIAPVEGGRWLVTLLGGGRDYPGTSEQEFLDFARSLGDPTFAAAYEAAEPLTPILATRSTENRLRAYDEVTRRPEGLLVIGDAVCAFNPVYGQGMSAAACGVLLLDECLRQFGAGTEGLASHFQKRLARWNRDPWLLATDVDYRYLETEGWPPGRLTRVMHRYLNRVVALTTRSPSACIRLLEVLHLMRSPKSLFSPGILLRSLLGI